MDSINESNSASAVPSSQLSDMHNETDINNAVSARVSTGPRTRAGKRQSAKNALKYGFFSREFVREPLPKADRKAYLRLLNEYIEEKCPVGSRELLQAEIYVLNMRHYYLITRLVSMHGYNSPVKSVAELLLAPEPDASGYLNDFPNVETLERLFRCAEHVLRIAYRADAELERLQNLRLGNKVPPRLHVQVG